MRVLHIDSNHDLLINQLQDIGFANDEDYTSSKAEIEEKIYKYDGIIIRSRFKIDKQFLDKATNLKFIGRVGAGLENIDCEYAENKGIKLIAAPEGNRNAVGEHSLGMLLSLFNKLNKVDNEVRKGIWLREENRGVELEGKTVGIIGYGNMGKSFAKKLQGFDVEVICYDIKDNVGDKNCKQVSLEELKEKTDVLSLHIPETELTINMLNQEFIDSFKKPFWLINTARGKNVVTADLVSALKSGKILGAGLDVLEYEKSSFENLFTDTMPKPMKYLIEAKNVILSPHIAGWTIESKEKLAQTIVDKIKLNFQEYIIMEQKETENIKNKVDDITNEAKAKIDELLKSETAENIKEKTEEITKEAKAKIDEVLNSDTAENIKEKAEEIANDAKIKIDEILNSESLKNLKGKASEYAELAGDKVKEIMESPEIKSTIKKGRKFINDILKPKK